VLHGVTQLLVDEVNLMGKICHLLHTNWSHHPQCLTHQNSHGSATLRLRISTRNLNNSNLLPNFYYSKSNSLFILKHLKHPKHFANCQSSFVLSHTENSDFDCLSTRKNFITVTDSVRQANKEIALTQTSHNYTVSQKIVPTFELTVTLSNLN